MATVNNQVAKIKLDVAIIGAGIGGLAAAIVSFVSQIFHQAVADFINNC